MPGVLNLGLLAHVDAGKTTLTEQILYRCGAIAQPGRVDDGTTHTDFLDIERQRGISVQAATTAFSFRGTKINLIDTPGHVDFVSEVERALRVLDVAVLIVSAAEGVQSHTRLLWEALREMGKPTLAFLNKLDRIGADPQKAMAELRQELGMPICPLRLEGTGETLRIANLEEVVEGLCEADDALMARYLDGESIGQSEALSALKAQVKDADVVPLLSGAALKGEGVEALLEALDGLAPRAGGDPKGELAGVVFRVAQDPVSGRIAHVRLYNGSLRNRDAVRNATRDAVDKVFQIKEIHADRSADMEELRAGDIGAVYGLGEVRVGDILGNPALVPSAPRIATPLLRVRVYPEEDAQLPALIAALDQLAAEDPLLESIWADRELQVCITGAIQLEVLEVLLRDRFGLNATFGPPTVIYKETPSTICEGFEAYTMPKPCWAVIRFLLEPLPRGSGVEYVVGIEKRAMSERYLGLIEQTLPEALAQGPLGWEVTDVRITLIEGQDHKFHTHPLDFALATPLAMMDGLVRGGTTLLEPMLWVRIVAPEEHSSRIVGDFLHMRGRFDSPRIQDGTFTLEGTLPVATSLDYPARLASLTGGQATLATRFDGYQECPLELGQTSPHRGVDPRDRSKYILWKRNALQG